MLKKIFGGRGSSYYDALSDSLMSQPRDWKRRQRRPEIEMLRCTLVHAVNISSAECAFPRDSRHGTIAREKITDCQLQSASSVVSNPVYTIQPVVNRLYRVNKHPTGCHTGCQTGLTTVLNEQPLFVQPVVKWGCTTGLTTGCTV